MRQCGFTQDIIPIQIDQILRRTRACFTNTPETARSNTYTLTHAASYRNFSPFSAFVELLKPPKLHRATRSRRTGELLSARKAAGIRQPRSGFVSGGREIQRGGGARREERETKTRDRLMREREKERRKGEGEIERERGVLCRCERLVHRAPEELRARREAGSE